MPSQYIISVDDTQKKVNLYRRHEDTAQTAHGSGEDGNVQEIVKSYEAKTLKRFGSASSAASTGAPTAPAFFPGKVKPPPPNVAQLAGWPGYAHSRLMPPPPKGEAPKPPPAAAAKVEIPKTPPKTPSKVETSAPHAPEVPKAAAQEEGEPAKKKAALTSVPADDAAGNLL